MLLATESNSRLSVRRSQARSSSRICAAQHGRGARVQGSAAAGRSDAGPPPSAAGARDSFRAAGGEPGPGPTGDGEPGPGPAGGGEPGPEPGPTGDGEPRPGPTDGGEPGPRSAGWGPGRSRVVRAGGRPVRRARRGRRAAGRITPGAERSGRRERRTRRRRAPRPARPWRAPLAACSRAGAGRRARRDITGEGAAGVGRVVVGLGRVTGLQRDGLDAGAGAHQSDLVPYGRPRTGRARLRPAGQVPADGSELTARHHLGVAVSVGGQLHRQRTFVEGERPTGPDRLREPRR